MNPNDDIERSEAWNPEHSAHLQDSDVDEYRKQRRQNARLALTRSTKKKVAKAKKLARYPVSECLVSQTWREDGYASLLVVRKKAKDRRALLSLLVDLGCLGVKEWLFDTDIEQSRADELHRGLFRDAPPVDVSPELAHRILQHATAWCQKSGLDVDPMTYVAEAFLSDADFHDSDESIPLGKKGKPFYYPGPRDDWEPVVEKLRDELGEDGFNYFVPLDKSGNLPPV